MKALTVVDREWITTPQAMRRLGRSARSLQRLATQGDLRYKLQDGSRARLYHAGDVERVKENATPAAREEARPARPEAIFAMLEEFFAKKQPLLNAAPPPPAVAAPPPTPKLVLTIPEAAELSGFSRSFIRRAIETKTLPYFQDGRRIKIARSVLEDFVQQGDH